MNTRAYWLAGGAVSSSVSLARMVNAGLTAEDLLFGLLWFGISWLYGYTMRPEVAPITVRGVIVAFIVVSGMVLVTFMVPVSQLPAIFLGGVGLVAGVLMSGIRKMIARHR